MEQHIEVWRADSHAELPICEDKGVTEETIFLIFRWNIVLHDSYQADEIVTEIEEWKQKYLGVYVKRFIIVLLSVLETSVVS